MASAAIKGLLPFIGKLANSTLFHVLRLTHLPDRRWPVLGLVARRPILFLWGNVAGIGDPIRNRLRGETGHRRGPTPESIRLIRCAAPVVSVIIPTYGQLDFTLRCLASIQANFPATPVEIIVVDDAFCGLEAEALARIRGVRLLRNTVNLGFLRTCNKAAQAASGEFLLFLNNDTEVRSGWLDRLVDVFASRPDTGLAGSKMTRPDGSLQEAGGILWRCGSAWNYGTGADPDAPEFNYLRSVDYCSGASLMVRRQVFLEVGGFDEKYAPAYFEDVDLAFRLRRRGLRTIYQPRSEVMHYCGASHGRDLRSGIKSCQVTNQVTFLETWREVLTAEHFTAGTHIARARDRAHDRPVVLVIDRAVPDTDHTSDILAVIRALLASGLVVKFWPLDPSGAPEKLQDMGVEVLYAPHHTSLADWLNVNGEDLDFVLLCRPDVAQACLKVVRSGTTARVVYYGLAIRFREMLAHAELSRDPGERRAVEAMRTLETRIWRNVDTVLCRSADEAADVRGLAPSVDVRGVVPFAFGGSIGALPANILRDGRPGDPLILLIADPGHQPDPDRGPSPDVEAACWFVHEVFPLVLAAVPLARLAILGSGPSPAVAALRGPRVGLYANVSADGLLAWYRRARVAVVPQLTSGGVKLRSAEALWHGVPAVLTPSGAHGLPDVHRVAAVAATPAAFAAAVVALLTDDTLWRRRRTAAADFARERFTEAAYQHALLLGLDLVAPPSRVPVGCEVLASMA